MSSRDTSLLCLKDSLEHLTATQQRLEWTEDREASRLLIETMLRDLERCRRLCLALRQRATAVA